MDLQDQSTLFHFRSVISDKFGYGEVSVVLICPCLYFFLCAIFNWIMFCKSLYPMCILIKHRGPTFLELGFV